MNGSTALEFKGNADISQSDASGAPTVDIESVSNFSAKFTAAWHGEKKPVPRPYLVSGVIPEQSTMLMVGESGVGKTYLATHLAVAMATGTDFLGKKTKRGGTLYVPAEAPDTIYERLDAACHALTSEEKEPPINFDKLPIAILNQIPNLAIEAEVDALIECAHEVAAEMELLHGVPLRLIEIDTMLAAFALADWNGASDATKAMMALAKISRETNTTVIGLHHHGKDLSRGAAGSFALTAHADVCLSIFQDVNSNGEVKKRWAAVTKLRRGRTGWGCYFDLVDVDIGMDADGQPASSAYVVALEEISAAQRSGGRNGEREGKAIKALMSAMYELSVLGKGACCAQSSFAFAISDIDLREAFGRHYPAESAGAVKGRDAARKAYCRAVKQAIDDGTIQTGYWDDRDWRWKPEKDEYQEIRFPN